MADAIPFTRGVPSADMLPVDDLRLAIATAMEREPVVALSYSTGGHPGLRSWIGARYGVPGERVICANGSLEAFAFVAAVLLARGSTARVLGLLVDALGAIRVAAAPGAAAFEARRQVDGG